MNRNRVLPGSCGCASRDFHLTGQELQVLMRVCADMHDREIAGELSLSARTIERHVANMRRKAGVQSRGGLIARAYATGVLRAGSWPPECSGLRCLAREPLVRTSLTRGSASPAPRARQERELVLAADTAGGTGTGLAPWTPAATSRFRSITSSRPSSSRRS